MKTFAICSTHLDDELEDKKPLIVSGLKIILQDPNLKVSVTVTCATIGS